MGILFLILLTAAVQLAAEDENWNAGKASLSGATGVIILPSARIDDAGTTLVTSGYSVLYSRSGFAHIPFLRLGFTNGLELHGATEIINESFDLLLGGSWRFLQREQSAFAAGLETYITGMPQQYDVAAHGYFVTTFQGRFIDFPATTTLLLGYTFDWEWTSDINFAVGFETPFFSEVLGRGIDFLLDFGNVSYSSNPSGGKAEERGLVNIGLRLLPIKLSPNISLGAKLAALDLFDASGRAISLSTSITIGQ
ncbi:MAG: hypothetical protein ACQEQU_02465 [Spirochaetota bacterium]